MCVSSECGATQRVLAHDESRHFTTRYVLFTYPASPQRYDPNHAGFPGQSDVVAQDANGAQR
jgi:hypothetical protein